MSRKNHLRVGAVPVSGKSKTPAQDKLPPQRQEPLGTPELGTGHPMEYRLNQGLGWATRLGPYPSIRAPFVLYKYVVHAIAQQLLSANATGLTA